MSKERAQSSRTETKNHSSYSPPYRLYQMEELYRSWGVFDLLQRTVDRLPPDWLRILNISRHLLDGKPIPGIEIPNALRALTEHNTIIDREKRLITRKWQEPTEVATNDANIRPIRSLIELPKVLPASLLLSDTNPDLFARKAAAGDIPIVENQKPRVVMEEKSETVEEVEEVRKQGSSLRQKVYILLDVSGSMKDNNKLIFAKAVIMAYMVKAFEEKAELYLRIFDHRLGERMNCISEDQFALLAKYVLGLKTYGNTDIGYALSKTESDIRKMDEHMKIAKTEIFLITDGATHKPINPMIENVTLHTLQLTDGTERQYELMGEGFFERRVAELAKESKTFTKINTSSLWLPDADEDLWLLREDIDRLMQELDSADKHDLRKNQDLDKRVERARKMARRYKKMYEKYNLEPKYTDIHDTDRKARKLKRKLGFKKAKKVIKDSVFKKRLNFQRKGARISNKFSAPNIKLKGTLFDFRIKKE